MRKWMKKWWVWVLIVLVVAVGWNVLRPKKSTTAAVKEVAVSRKDVVSSILASGSIVADKQANLRFLGGGKLAYLGVKEGDRVEAWQTLASLDTGSLDTAVTTAYNRYLAADANAKAVEDMAKNHDTNEDFDLKNTRVAAQTARDMAYDAWLQARRDKQNAYIVAPFAGVVTTVMDVAPGAIVGPTDIITVVDPSKLVFSAQVDETDIGKVNSNQQIIVTLDAFPGQQFQAKISEIGFVTQVSSSGATVVPIKIELAGDINSKLIVGMNGDAEIVLQEKKNVLSLPTEAIVNGEVTLPGNEAKKVKVQTGLEGDTDVEITAGLNEGDRVIIK
jgi:HlyD family secretion protein